MGNVPRLRAWIATLSLAALAGGCAAPYAPPNPPLERSVKRELINTFSAGYRDVSEQYIDEVDVETIAMNGIKGFSSIDPALSVRREKEQVILYVSDSASFQAIAPQSDNSIGWAALTSDIIEAAKQVSPEMDNASSDRIYEAVFDGVMSGLDLFSRYVRPDEAKRDKAKREGFGGIGILLSIKDRKAVVRDVLTGRPADRRGVEAGDIITEIDMIPVHDMDRDEVLSRLRGPILSEVRLTLERPGKTSPLHVDLTREHIIPDTVFEHRDGPVVTYRISAFNKNTTNSLHDLLNKVRIDLGRGLKGIVLDLRGNPGGLLRQSVSVADLLLADGNIVSTKGRYPDSLSNYEAGSPDVTNGLPVAVLIDGKSASAAEILAAALQDSGRAVVIGTASFGKGSVQHLIELPNKGEIRLTWSRFLAPSGYPLHGLGVRPILCTSDRSRDFDSLLSDLKKDVVKLSDTFDSWRVQDFQAEEVRNRLRETCPPEKHDTDHELKVAKKLLSDPVTYAWVADVINGTSQARK